jgi:hypothetical protein
VAPLYHPGPELSIEDVDVAEGLLANVGVVPRLTLNLMGNIARSFQQELSWFNDDSWE